MSLSIILICLLAERFLLEYQHLRQTRWINEYSDWFERQELPHWMLNGFGGVVSLLLPPLLTIALLQQLLDERLLGIPGALLAILVLLFSFGPRDLDHQIRQLHDARERHDGELTTEIGRDIIGDEPPSDETRYSHAIVESILEQANRRIFGVIFWFLVLGPVGAALYRLATCLPNLRTTAREADFLHTSRQLVAILDWIPARLTAASYAIAGSFEDALYGWRSYHESRFNEFSSSASGILICTGTGALRLSTLVDSDTGTHPTEGQRYLMDAAMGLIWRSLVVWIILIGLLTLAGWF
ncbi:MAG: regulatory signaling modulator protein AmpE [Gammaproteobacteria bacterium]|nr:regulatory signaling modulator protein AmpE [Gammaproteobacteria bacterium]